MGLFFATILVQTAALHVAFVEIDKRWKRPAVDLSHLDAEERRRRARFMNRLGTGLGMLLWPVLMVGWFFLFRWFADHPKIGVPGVRYLIRPQMGYSFLAPLFTGIALSGLVAAGLLRLVRLRTYYEDMACGDELYGYDARRFFYVCVVWIVPLGLDWEFAFVNSWTAVTDDAIVCRDLMRLSPETYPLAGVAHIYGVRVYEEIPGAIAPKPSFKVTFRDGRSWTNAMAAHYPLPGDRDAIDFISRRSGRPIEWVNAIP
jgi:hypothetical protein